MKEQHCGYCVHGEPLQAFGIYVCDLPHSQLILFKEQSHKGRCIVATKEHVDTITDLSDDERNGFFADVNNVVAALTTLYHPDRVNFGAYADTFHHFHVHLVPKYKDGFEWNGVFQMNPQKIFLSDVEYEALVAELKAAVVNRL